jgi:hypothetical protein
MLYETKRRLIAVVTGAGKLRDDLAAVTVGYARMLKLHAYGAIEMNLAAGLSG